MTQDSRRHQIFVHQSTATTVRTHGSFINTLMIKQEFNSPCYDIKEELSDRKEEEKSEQSMFMSEAAGTQGGSGNSGPWGGQDPRWLSPLSTGKQSQQSLHVRSTGPENELRGNQLEEFGKKHLKKMDQKKQMQSSKRMERSQVNGVNYPRASQWRWTIYW